MEPSLTLLIHLSSPASSIFKISRVQQLLTISTLTTLVQATIIFCLGYCSCFPPGLPAYTLLPFHSIGYSTQEPKDDRYKVIQVFRSWHYCWKVFNAFLYYSKANKQTKFLPVATLSHQPCLTLQELPDTSVGQVAVSWVHESLPQLKCFAFTFSSA